MGLSRRKITREAKMVAVQRLETGFPIAEVTRAYEVDRMCSTAGGASSAEGGATPFLGHSPWGCAPINLKTAVTR
jgi:hypothetical protein